MMDSQTERGVFDRSAAITRSLLGYGVLSGVFYLVVGLTLASTRDGFDLATHPLSLLMLGEGGWMQRANLLLSGVMVIAASIGIRRAMAGSRVRAGPLVLLFGISLIVAGLCPPDPMAGFPPGTVEGPMTTSGIIHLAAGAVGFLALAGAAWVMASWQRQENRPVAALLSRLSSLVILIGFLAGAAITVQPAGVALLWLAVVVGWVWLAATSIVLYRIVPHPDSDLVPHH